MKVLLLGGTGILSTDVCKYAISQGYEVTCINRGNRSFALPDGAKSIIGDVNYLDTIEEKLEVFYDVVFDFLSYNVKQLEKKITFFDKKCKQYFFISSATAYKIDKNPITENTPLGNQYWDYGQNKVECENYLYLIKKRLSCQFTIIRPYVTYGNTRIPFAIIPDGCYWSLANRIIGEKPILLWDGGKATCTITHTSDFARGVVGLIGKESSFGEAFNVTSNESLTWKEVLLKIGNALSMEPVVFSAPTDEIIKQMPEYRGTLLGDKARNRVFNNSKITGIVPEFVNTKPFSKGIEETIAYYKCHENERNIDYLWDGKVDRVIIYLSKQFGINVDKSCLKFFSTEAKVSLKDRIRYYIGKYRFLFKIYITIKR